jgi:formamidopyrimidine-DNA glycosylase
MQTLNSVCSLVLIFNDQYLSAESIATVLKKAIKGIGAANGDELKGELKDFMIVHSPKLKTTDRGEVIKTEKIGGRTTYYTDAQELFH